MSVQTNGGWKVKIAYKTPKIKMYRFYPLGVLNFLTIIKPSFVLPVPITGRPVNRSDKNGRRTPV